MNHQNKSTRSVCSVLKPFLRPTLRTLNSSKVAMSTANSELHRPINYLGQEYYILLSTQTTTMHSDMRHRNTTFVSPDNRVS